MKTILLLFLEFFKTGLFAVGGGLATIPFLSEMEGKYPQWFQQVKLSDIIAIAESTPGPIGVNVATFAGYSAAGIPGALIATFSLILPSFIIIVLIADVYQKYRNSKLVSNAFLLLHPAVTGLIAAAALSIIRMAIFIRPLPGVQSIDICCLTLYAFFLFATQIKKLSRIHPILYICIGAVIGIALSLQ